MSSIGGSNEQLLVWQMSTGELVASLRRHYQDVTGICFTADGSRFVSAGAEGLVLVWSLETALLNRYSNASVTFSPSTNPKKKNRLIYSKT